MYYVNPCWVILCQSQFNNYGLQLYTIQKYIVNPCVILYQSQFNNYGLQLYTIQKYIVNPCWVILYQSQFNNYGLQLYTIQKCIMSTLIGLFYAKASLTIMVSNYIQYKNV